MNDFLIFGSTGLTGGYFLDEVKNRNQKYHLFTRKLLETESVEDQTLLIQKIYRIYQVLNPWLFALVTP